jgi:cathepsin L
MKSYRVGVILATVLMVLGIVLAVSAQVQKEMKPTPAVKPEVLDFKARELAAPPKIKMQLENLRKDIQTKNLKFQVGYTTALDFTIEQLAGTKAPADLAVRAPKQNAVAMKVLSIDLSKRDEFAKRNPGKLPELVLMQAPGKCSATAKSFDWRNLNKVTPVRNQGGCGSCWAFTAMGAYEGSYLIRNNKAIDTAEQQILNCTGAGSCGGGWWAGVFNYLAPTGTATEASYLYTANDKPCQAGIATPYHAITWGYVKDDGGIPTVSQLKQALCQYGPLAVAVRVTGAFQAYSGGVFNENAPGNINHGVTLIGWDDDKGAWLIKNSWGTGWGMNGYMWIAYGSNKIGDGAAWVQAKNELYPLEDCISFDYQKAAVSKVQGRWKIVVGNMWLMDFGDKEKEARQALKIIQGHHLNKQCFVGRPGPSMEYYLVSDKSPTGTLAGEDCVSFNPANIDVNKIEGRWKINDGPHWIADFGDKEGEAWLSLTLIKKYGFNRNCYVGRPGPSMTYFRR